jgi:hypothetical protein
VENADFSQLGVNASNAIVVGGLAGKSQFFGTSTAETVSGISIASGSWNGDHAESVDSGGSWAVRGSLSVNGPAAGVFGALRYNGGTHNNGTRRTILSGY